MIHPLRSEEAIFAAVIEQPTPEARAALLDQICRDNAELRVQVEQLIWAHEHPDSFLQATSSRGSAALPGTLDSPSFEQPGTEIGHYKLLEKIGEGGMGVVYLAEQRTPVRRSVALKIVKPGMDTREVVARFEAERQALALMNHPNIARVLDAGATPSGRPYFVMELVKGSPITEFCDEQRLDLRARLRLFITACQAVQHAHQKGLIHRDLKPSNLLVEVHDVTAVPKVIDFGVAKAIGRQLGEKTVHTGFSQMVGTPLYMSPEQAGQSALDVDTRSDIYSLGVLLYELLTSQTPFEQATFRALGIDEMRRMIREVDPPRPSARLSTMARGALSTLAEKRQAAPRNLSQQLHGELDWIVMKCLEKDRNRRYESAAGLARDLERYLADDPVEARPPSRRYRVSKLLRRNKGPAIAVSAVLVALVVGIIGTMLGLVRATTAERLAEQRLQQVDTALTLAVKAEDDTVDAYRAATDEALEHLIGSKDDLGPQEKVYLEGALKRWLDFANRKGDDERSQYIRGMGHFFVGKLRMRLGLATEAQTDYEAALNIQKVLVKQIPTAPDYRHALGKTHQNLGLLLADLGKTEQARAQYTNGIEIHKQLVQQFPAVEEYQDVLANVHHNLGVLLHRLGQTEEGRTHLEASLEMRKQLVERSPSIPKYQHALANSHSSLGVLLDNVGRTAPARAEFDAAISIQKRVVEKFPTNSEFWKRLSVLQRRQGNLLSRLGEPQDALAEYESALAISKRLAAQFPALRQYQEDLAEIHATLGALLAALGKREQAQNEFVAALEIRKRLVNQFPSVPDYQALLAVIHNDLAVLFERSGKFEQARTEFAQAIAILKSLSAHFPTERHHQDVLANAHSNLGLLLMRLGNANEARTEFVAAIDIRMQQVLQFPHLPKYQEGLADVHNNLALLLAGIGNIKEARAENDQAREIRRQLVETFPSDAPYLIALGGSYCNSGLYLRDEAPAEALKWFDLGIQILTPVHEQNRGVVEARSYLRNCHYGRYDAYFRLGMHAEALADCNRTIELSERAEQAYHRARRAILKLHVGQIVEAASEVDELTTSQNWPAAEWYSFASVYAIAGGKLADMRQEYAARAMVCLKKAVGAGWSDGAQIAKNPDFDWLRERDDFTTLIGMLPAPPAEAVPSVTSDSGRVRSRAAK